MQGPLGLQSLHPSAAHVIPIASVIYFVWAGVEKSIAVQMLMWILVLFFSLPMLAYLETMKAAMPKYESGLVPFLARERLKIGPEYWSGLMQVLPWGRLFAVFVVGQLSSTSSSSWSRSHHSSISS